MQYIEGEFYFAAEVCDACVETTRKNTDTGDTHKARRKLRNKASECDFLQFAVSIAPIQYLLSEISQSNTQ